MAEIPAIAGCHALMPTVEGAVTELRNVFLLIEEEHRADGQTLPRDTTEIVRLAPAQPNCSVWLPNSDSTEPVKLAVTSRGATTMAGRRLFPFTAGAK